MTTQSALDCLQREKNAVHVELMDKDYGLK